MKHSDKYRQRLRQAFPKKTDAEIMDLLTKPGPKRSADSDERHPPRVVLIDDKLHPHMDDIDIPDTLAGLMGMEGMPESMAISLAINPPGGAEAEKLKQAASLAAAKRHQSARMRRSGRNTGGKRTAPVRKAYTKHLFAEFIIANPALKAQSRAKVHKAFMSYISNVKDAEPVGERTIDNWLIDIDFGS